MRDSSFPYPILLVCAGLALAGCGDISEDDPGRSIVVEDAGPVPIEPAPDFAVDSAPRERTEPAPAEIVLAPDEDPAVGEEPPEVTDDPVEAPRREDPAERAGDLEPRTEEFDAADAEPFEIEPVEPVRSGPVVVPEGTRFDAELRTPFHSATSRVGDRFAARMLEPLERDGRLAVPKGALVEGRVVRVASAEDDEGPGLVELELVSLVLPPGERIPLDARVVGVEPRKVVTGGGAPRAAGAVTGAGAGAAAGGILVGGRGGAAIGAILGGVAGAALLSGDPDHELVVPGGTILAITLRGPLEVPAGE